VLDVVMRRAGLVAGEERRQRARGVGEVDDRDDEQQQADDDGGDDQGGTLGHGGTPVLGD
jgi:hypothetical protein